MDLRFPVVTEKMCRVLLRNIYTQFCLSQQVLKVRVHMTICVSFPSDDFLSDSLFGDMFIRFILSMILALPCCYWSIFERMVKRGSSEQGLRNHTALWSALFPWPGAHHLSSFSLSIFLGTTVCVAAATYQVSYKFQPLVYCWFLEGSFRILVQNEVLKWVISPTWLRSNFKAVSMSNSLPLWLLL